MSKRFLRRLLPILLLCSAVVSTGCLNLFWRPEARAIAVRDLARQGAPVDIRTPVRAHLADGSTVVFRSGVQIQATALYGDGERYPLLAGLATRQTSVPLDSVVGVETFENKLLAAPTIIASVAATAAAIPLTALLLVAIFGSCPTVYADTGGTEPVLEAEGFSYAIAPLLEHRDVDPLRVRPGADGRVRLELRNEALETHYINHIELLAVNHPAGTRVVPDQRGLPVIVADVRALTRATDRARRDIREVVAAPDGRLFSSARSVVDGAREGDLDDWIDVSADDLPPGDSLAVVLRLRNSLLNTVLLYEGVLGGRDAPDYLASGLQHISEAIEMSRWYARTMGLRVEVAGIPTTTGEAQARLGDVGPIAFRDVAIVLPRPVASAKHVDLRLRFVADNWRIDHATIAGTIARPAARPLPVREVLVPVPAAGGGPVMDTAAVRALAAPDERYLETNPGQRMTLVFDAAPATASQSTTYLLGWQGWYSEWIRGQWLAHPARTTPFVPGDAAVITALHRWRERQPELERQFYSTRLPVR